MPKNLTIWKNKIMDNQKRPIADDKTTDFCSTSRKYFSYLRAMKLDL